MIFFMKNVNISFHVFFGLTELIEITMKERCQPCKQWAEHFYWNHFKPKGMSFIKVMDSGFSQGMHLLCMQFIPVKFVKNVKRKLPDNMSLRDPNGNLWSIKLFKVPGSLLVKDGWKEFVDANHVEKKDFLVFRYDGKACFNVLIFDQSGCEKEASFIVRTSNAFECPQVTKDEYDSLEEKVSASFVEEQEHAKNDSSTCHTLINITNYRGRYIQRGTI
ncbi:putative transcription factor B3-Domain family [Dioscorea sansibarensis]